MIFSKFNNFFIKKNVIFFLCFLSIFLNYINFPFNLFNFNIGLHNPFFYVIILFTLLLIKEVDLNYLNFFNLSANKLIFFSLVSVLFISLIFNPNSIFEIYQKKLMVLFCIITFFLGPNLSKIINFKFLIIINIFLIFLFFVMSLPYNSFSHQICYPLIDYLPRVFCSSIYGYHRGVSLLTSEPSFASLQVAFLIICNLFYLNIFCKSAYEKIVIYFFVTALSLILLFLKSKLGVLIFIFIILNLLIYFIKKIKINTIWIITFSILLFLSILSFTDYLIKEFFFHSFKTSCSNILVSIFFRSISYITIFLAENKSIFAYLFNFKGLFFGEELSNRIYISFIENNYYLSNLCNGYLKNTFLNNPDKFLEPQPLLMKLLFEEGIIAFGLFLTYIFINLKKNYKFVIYKNLSLFIFIYLLFFQSSFLLVYNGILFQIYNYEDK